MTLISKPPQPIITVDDQQAAFAAEHHTLLDALLQQGIEAEYHCKDGFCGACRCQLLSGQVSYLTTPIAFIGEGEILTCCTQPLDDIEISLQI